MDKAKIREAIESFPDDVWFSWYEVAARLGQEQPVSGTLEVARRLEETTYDKSRLFGINNKGTKGIWTANE